MYKLEELPKFIEPSPLTELLVVNSTVYYHHSLPKELVEDLITIISHFAGKLYGMRSRKYKKVIEGAKKLIQDP